MLCTFGMGANGVLTTGGMGYNSTLEIVVVVDQPANRDGSFGGGGGSSTRRVVRRIRHEFPPEHPLDEYLKDHLIEDLIDHLIREDEEIVTIIVSATEDIVNAITQQMLAESR